MSWKKYIKDRSRIDSNGCWRWRLATNADGYGVASQGHKAVRAHRLSWSAFIGDIPDGVCVLHKCDVRDCVNPGHLFLGSIKDNAEDMVKKGRSMFGSKHHKAKLSEGRVRKILLDPRS